jgi:hypothetical protein
MIVAVRSIPEQEVATIPRSRDHGQIRIGRPRTDRSLSSPTNRPAMPEHAIQLRRAWDYQANGATRRVDLPTSWGDRPVTFRLARSFRRPPIDTEFECLTLRLGDVAGLRAVWLNGQELPIEPGATHFELELSPDLPGRNRIELEVVPVLGMGPDAPWGSIALVIRPR